MATFLENIELSKENIRDLRELINVNTLRDERIQDFVRVIDAHPGDRIGLISGIELGKAGCACGPTYESMSPDNAERLWSLGCWSAPLKVCHTDMAGTIGEYALKNGSNMGDLTGTQILSEVIEPIIADSYMDFLWRIAWFGDTAADHISDGGKITNGTDLDLIQVADGFWKHIYTQVGLVGTQRTTIATNTKAAMTAQGAATGCIEQIILDASGDLMSLDNKVIYMTQAMATALSIDMKRTYSCALTWEVLTDGSSTTTYDGIKYVALPKWDKHISTYENGVNPYRALLTTRDNLLVGIPGAIVVEVFDMFFDRSDRYYKIYGAGKIGTMLLNPAWFQVAY